MQSKKINKKYVILGICLVFAGTLLLTGFSFAQNCPSSTTVTGTTVNFVGEITEMGGDTTVTAWFEYGQNTGYGQRSPEIVSSQTGPYCITVSNLSSCTTYHYRAVARNTAGTSYGEDKTFTTTCGPTVDLKVNGSDGPVSVTYGGSATLSWSSNNANSCTASGNWSGSKSTSGSETVSNITSSRTFTLTCTGSAGSSSDSVNINVGSPSLSASLSASPSSGCAPLNSVNLTASVSGNISGDITYFFDCTNDGNWEKIITAGSNSYTAYNICNFGSVGNYTAKVRVENQGVSAENTTNINVLSCYSSPSVDLKVNGSDGSITIPYNTAANLSWTSNNANYCSASGAWSGAKAISGSESTGNLFSSKSYAITCTGLGGSNTDSVTVNVSTAASLTVNKLVRNLSRGTAYLDSVTAEPFDVVSFSITITAGNSALDNVTVKETLPDKIVFRQNSLKVDGVSSSGDITSGLNIGNLSANQKKTITYDADILGSDKFAFGNTQLVNSVTAYTGNTSGSDTANIVVTRKAVAGATTVSTGLTNDLFVDSFLLPLVIALLIIWLLKAKIVKFEEWLDNRKNQYQNYKSKKILQMRVKKIRLWELLKKYRFTKS